MAEKGREERERGREGSHWEWELCRHPRVYLAHMVGFLEKQEQTFPCSLSKKGYYRCSLFILNLESWNPKSRCLCECF